MKSIVFLILFAVLLVLASLVVWPRLDLFVSGLFYRPDEGFFLAHQPFYLFMQGVAFDGARVLGLFLALATLITFAKHRLFLGLDQKAWLFLFIALLLGPGLIANVIFKDHWGRARPREIVEFGGHATFSPALVPQVTEHTNSSFISGDASFGFYLPSLAYVVPRSRTRHVFWGGISLGVLFSFCRLAMGAHFLSDILFAAVFMLMASAGLHAALYGGHSTRQNWRHWFFR